MSCKWKCIYENIGRKGKTRVKTVACNVNKKHCSSNKFEKCVVSTKTGKPAVYKARAQGTCWQKDLFALWQQEVENKATAYHTHHYFFCLTKRMTGWNHKDLCVPNREKWLAILTNIYGDLDKLSSNAKRIT